MYKCRTWKKYVPAYEVKIAEKISTVACPYCHQHSLRNRKNNFIQRPLLHTIPHFIINKVYMCDNIQCKHFGRYLTCWDEVFNKMHSSYNKLTPAMRIGNKGHYYITHGMLSIMMEIYKKTRSIDMIIHHIKSLWTQFFLDQSQEYLNNPTTECM